MQPIRTEIQDNGFTRIYNVYLRDSDLSPIAYVMQGTSLLDWTREPATVNYSSVGAQSPEIVTAIANAMLEAARQARVWNKDIGTRNNSPRQ